MVKQLLTALTIGSAVYAMNTQAAFTSYASFIAEPGKSALTTQRAGCGKAKELPYYHHIELYKENKFTESIYISGIAEPDLQLTGSWAEIKHNKILLSYDGDINLGSSGENTGWAVIMGDIENQLTTICRSVGSDLTPAVTQLKNNVLKINARGDKAKLKVTITSKSQGGLSKPKSTRRDVSAKGLFVSSAR